MNKNIKMQYNKDFQEGYQQGQNDMKEEVIFLLKFISFFAVFVGLIVTAAISGIIPLIPVALIWLIAGWARVA